MTLLKISLYMAPLALFGLAGCGEDKVCDTGADCPDADADTDTDTDTEDTDTETPVDTAVGYVFYAGDAQTSGGEFVGGHFGYVVTDYGLASICDDLSVWSENGSPAASGCPDCAWSFNLDLAGGTATGSKCGDMLPSAMTGGAWDGFTASWGFADTYSYDYNGTPLLFETVLFYYSTYTGSEGWFPLMYNYGAYGYNSGNAENLTFMRYVGYIYYYP